MCIYHAGITVVGYVEYNTVAYYQLNHTIDLMVVFMDQFVFNDYNLL